MARKKWLFERAGEGVSLVAFRDSSSNRPECSTRRAADPSPTCPVGIQESAAHVPKTVVLWTAEGQVGLALSRPRYGRDRTPHVLSDDPPTVRTLREFERREAVEAAFRDDKSAGFQLERSRNTDPHRLDRLLGAMALAQVFLKLIGTRVQ